MALQRLPLVNSDDGIWGDNLNQYLGKEHYNGSVDYTTASPNGGHKTITIQPGTTAALTAPLKFTAGPLMTTAEAGAVEFNSDKLYITTSTPTRKTIAAYDDSAGGGGAAGDLHYRDSSGNFVRLPIGSSTNVLTVSGGLPAWSASGSGTNRSISSVSTGTAAGNSANMDYVYLVTGITTVTLPTAVGNLNKYTITNVSTNIVTVATTSAQTIDGLTNYLLDDLYFSIDVMSNGSSWYII